LRFDGASSADATAPSRLHLLFGQDPTYAGDEAPPVATTGESISANVQFDGWGYVHLLDARTMEQLDAYAIDEALDPAFAQGFGDLSVHEVAVDPFRKNIAYLSYDAGGLRVVHYDEKTGITEVGADISPEGNNFWGVRRQQRQGPGRSPGQGEGPRPARDPGEGEGPREEDPGVAGRTADS
jgi:hypothetical protein